MLERRMFIVLPNELYLPEWNGKESVFLWKFRWLWLLGLCVCLCVLLLLLRYVCFLLNEANTVLWGVEYFGGRVPFTLQRSRRWKCGWFGVCVFSSRCWIVYITCVTMMLTILFCTNSIVTVCQCCQRWRVCTQSSMMWQQFFFIGRVWVSGWWFKLIRIEDSMTDAPPEALTKFAKFAIIAEMGMGWSLHKLWIVESQKPLIGNFVWVFCIQFLFELFCRTCDVFTISVCLNDALPYIQSRVSYTILWNMNFSTPASVWISNAITLSRKQRV